MGEAVKKVLALFISGSLMVTSFSGAQTTSLGYGGTEGGGVDEDTPQANQSQPQQGNYQSNATPKYPGSGSEDKKGMRTSAAAMLMRTSAAAMLLNKSCRFKKESRGLRDMLEATKSVLQQLSDDKTCVDVQAAARQMDSIFSESLLKALPGNASSGYGGETASITCSNYQQNLAFDFNMAVKINRTDATMVPSTYASCVPGYAFSSETSGVLVTADDFNKCAKNRYLAQLEHFSSTCPFNKEAQSKASQNQQLRTSLNQLAQNAENLIRAAGSCKSSTVTQSVIHTSMQTLTALAALSPGAGLAGAGVAMAGKLVSALVDSFFDKKSPDEILKLIRREDEMEEINCVNYILQRETLQCENLIFDSPPGEAAPEAKDQACISYYYGTSNSVSALSRSLQSVVDSARSAGRGSKALDGLLKGMTMPIHDPVNGKKAIPMSEYLTDISEALAKDPSIESQTRSKELKYLLDSYQKVTDSLNPEIKQSNRPSLSEAVGQFQQAAMMMAQKSDTGSVFEDSIEQYWNIKGKSAEFAAIKGYGRLQSDLQQGYQSSLELFKALQDYEASGSAQRKLDVAHSGFMDVFKPRFDKRLLELNENFEGNRNRQTKKDSVKDLVPIIQLCVLNAGAFYFGESKSNLKSRNNISSSIPETYRKVCGKLDCHMKIFDPSGTAAPGERSMNFRVHQCGLLVKYPEILTNAVKDFESKGTVCGK